MTIQEAVDAFLKWKDTHMDNSYAYRVALRPLTNTYGDMRAEKLTIQEVTALASSLGSPQMFMRVLKIFARYCFWAKIETINPNLINTKRMRDPTDQPFIKEDDVETMCSILPDDTFLGVRNQLIVRLLFETGVRLSELLELKVSQMDAQNRSVKIVTKKSRINRYIMWSEDTHHLLQTYLAMRVSKDWRTDNLFINKHGAILTKRGVEYMFNKISEEALGERHHPHECRHGKAHNAMEKGATVYDIRAILGHKNLESALTYLRLHASESLAIVKRYI